MTTREWIEEYRRLGWKVLPVPRDRKHPVERGWPDRDSIEATDAERMGETNLGIQTGAVSGLIVLDVDGVLGAQSLSALVEAHGALPSGPRQATGRTEGGMHIIFQWPTELTERRGATVNRVGEGLDVRGFHAMICVEPSVHPSTGNAYRWHNLHLPIPEMPNWLKTLVIRRREVGEGRSSVERASLSRIASILASRECEGPGDGSNAKMGTACHACHLGVRNAEDFVDAAHDWNQRRETPWRGDELRTAFEDAFARFESEGQRPALDRGGELCLARRVLDEIERLWEVMSDRGYLWRYLPDRGVWEKMDDHEIKHLIMEWDGHPTVGGARGPGVLTLNHKFIKGTLACILDSKARPGFFDNPVRGFGFKNGFLAVGNSGFNFVEHDRGHRITEAVGEDWDPTEKCPAWLAFLNDVWIADADAHLKIDFLQEFVGACLIGKATRYQKTIVLEGEGRNGKSIMVDVISSLFPEATVAAIPPQLWTDQYRRAALAGIRLNAMADLPESDMLDSSSIKAIITGDKIDAREIRRSPFSYHPSAGHLFSANSLPGVRDMTEGFWRRWAVLTFGRVFDGRVGRDELYRSLIEEKSGIRVWALEGAKRLLSRGFYEVPPSSEDAVNAWRLGADQVGAFVGEEYRRPEDNEWGMTESMPTLEDLYLRYQAWCVRTGHGRMSSSKLARRMAHLKITTVRDGGRHGRPRVYALLPPEQSEASAARRPPSLN